jgi:hypothetical protein
MHEFADLRAGAARKSHAWPDSSTDALAAACFPYCRSRSVRRFPLRPSSDATYIVPAAEHVRPNAHTASRAWRTSSMAHYPRRG